MEQDGPDAIQPAGQEPLARGRSLSHDEQVAVAAAEVAWLEVLCQGLKDGTRSWAEWDESLGDMPDRAEVATGRCEAALEQAREELRTLSQSAKGESETEE
jgi:hypothetical protein